MDKKKFFAQVGTGFVLYVLISLILEGDMSSDILIRELRDGLIFGLLYAAFLWIWNWWKSRKKP